MAYTTINKSTDYFNTVTTTGGAKSITGVGFQPDWIWSKRRDSTSDHHVNDAVRGASKLIYTNATTAEQTNANFLTSFDSDGFTTGSAYWSSSANIVAWNWKANGTGSANTDGTINSTVSVNTTAGFSIVKYTGNGSGEVSIGHGLGTTPKVMIVKSLSSGNWFFYTTVIDNSLDYLFLNLTDAKGDSSATAPTSSVIYGVQSTNQAENYIAYCFAEKTGYSKFGKYTGNGNADGTFVYTGFKPAFLMIKRTDNTSNWLLYDNKREGYNQVNDYLNPDNSNAEAGGDNYPDLYSNGFKPRVGSQSINVSGATYIYMAFGQSIVGSNNIPATAR